MTRLLVGLPCPFCNARLHSVEYIPTPGGGPPRARSYETCLRQCEVCGVGLSNCLPPRCPVVIYRDPLDNVPIQVRDGVRETLANALNVRNRPTKLQKFASITSEDAITWTVFRHLQQVGLLRCFARRCGLGLGQDAGAEPALLLWGVPIPMDNPPGCDVLAQLIGTLNALRNRPQSRTEPDVLLDFAEEGVAIIEVKYGSPNDLKPNAYSGWAAYLHDTEAFTDGERLRRTGLYELARNWRIGWDHAEARPLAVVNLGPGNLFDGDNARLLEEFEACLSRSERRQFVRLTWGWALAGIPHQPDWLQTYLRSRGLGKET